MFIASFVVALYPGSVYDTELWLWLSVFVGMSVWPDLDLRFELKHRGYTHTLAGALVFGVLGAAIFGLAHPSGALCGFLGGFGGTLSHILGDLMTYAKFRPLWPLSSREFAFGWFSARDVRVNKVFAELGTYSLFLAVLYRALVSSGIGIPGL